jgi:transcriptional regulator of acetoin/glycerol metabolism
MPPAVSDPETRRAIRHLIEYYNRSLGEGETKTLILADLYLKLGDEPDGRRHLKNAADTLRRSGQMDRALVFYDRLLENFRGRGTTEVEAEEYLDSALGKISSGGRNGAAAILGLKPTTLFFRMKKLGLRK